MPERTPITPSGVAPNPALSPGLKLGDLLFVSGNVATDRNGNLVGEGDCEAQSRQVLANVRTIVEAAGSTMQDVVKITCFLILVLSLVYMSSFAKLSPLGVSRCSLWCSGPSLDRW